MGIMLNKGQQDIVREAVHWYHKRNDQIFQIQGPPGTGKSVTLNAIIDALGIPRYSVAPMSFIGAAAINMRMKGFYNARTIHSWIYNLVQEVETDENGVAIMDDYFHKPKKKWKFVPKPLIGTNLIVIDEAYATPYSLKKDIENNNLPIIAAGDKDQLPPVGDDPAYLVNGKIYYLNEIMRQSEGSAIIMLSQRINAGLPIHKGWYGNVLVIDPEELSDEMILGADVVICARNETRENMNKYIRYKLLGYNSDVPGYMERMVCRKNNFRIELNGIALANGLIGDVVSAVDPTSFDGKLYTMDFKANGVDTPFRRIKCDYNYLQASPAERQKMKMSRYAFGEKFEFAYAVTTHISQGSEWNRGIYIEESLNPDVDKKLNYVGITRFRDQCIYVRQRK